jgi:hypothetical protein
VTLVVLHDADIALCFTTTTTTTTTTTSAFVSVRHGSLLATVVSGVDSVHGIVVFLGNADHKVH